MIASIYNIDIDEQKMKDFLELVHLNDKKMNDVVDRFSLGEKRRFLICLSLMKKVPIIVMDEPTAALDPIAESEIYENFNELIHNKTAIFISHRMSSCKFCDEIIVFQDGEIIQHGTHNELVEQEGLYHELWNAQAQYYA